MRRSRTVFGLLLAGVLALPGLPATAAFQAPLEPAATSSEPELLARKGGGGRKGGGSRKSSSRSSKGRSGFKSSNSGLNRGSNKPKGGYKKSSRSSGSPSLNRKSGSGDRSRTASNRTTSNRTGSNRDGNRNRDNVRNRRDDRTASRGDRRNDRNRDDRFENRQDRRDERVSRNQDRRDERFDRRGDRWDDRYDRRSDRWDDRWDRRNDRWNDRWDRYPGWARPGWGYARPWNYGWYGGWSRPSWGWWGASAAAWGVTTLATAAVINSAVDNAVSSHTTYIVVPNSDYRLLYGTVEPVGTQAVSFEAISGDTSITMQANCDQGTLNGSTPNSASEAELLNAACQVAYGSV